MVAFLRIMLAYDPRRGDTGPPDYRVLRREIELPFPPFPGLMIDLPGLVMEDDPKADQLDEACKLAPQVLGVFEVRRVRYSVDFGETEIDVLGHNCESREELSAAQTVLELDYGFQPYLT